MTIQPKNSNMHHEILLRLNNIAKAPYLIVDEKTQYLKETTRFQALFQKIKGVFGLEDLTNPDLIELKIIEDLKSAKEQGLFKRPNLNFIHQLAKKCNLLPNEEHRDLARLIHEIREMAVQKKLSETATDWIKSNEDDRDSGQEEFQSQDDNAQENFASTDQGFSEQKEEHKNKPQISNAFKTKVHKLKENLAQLQKTPTSILDTLESSYPLNQKFLNTHKDNLQDKALLTYYKFQEARWISIGKGALAVLAILGAGMTAYRAFGPISPEIVPSIPVDLIPTPNVSTFKETLKNSETSSAISLIQPTCDFWENLLMDKKQIPSLHNEYQATLIKPFEKIFEIQHDEIIPIIKDSPPSNIKVSKFPPTEKSTTRDTSKQADTSSSLWSTTFIIGTVLAVGALILKYLPKSSKENEPSEVTLENDNKKPKNKFTAVSPKPKNEAFSSPPTTANPDHSTHLKTSQALIPHTENITENSDASPIGLLKATLIPFANPTTETLLTETTLQQLFENINILEKQAPEKGALSASEQTQLAQMKSWVREKSIANFLDTLSSLYSSEQTPLQQLKGKAEDTARQLFDSINSGTDVMQDDSTQLIKDDSTQLIERVLKDLFNIKSKFKQNTVALVKTLQQGQPLLAVTTLLEYMIKDLFHDKALPQQSLVIKNVIPLFLSSAEEIQKLRIKFLQQYFYPLELLQTDLENLDLKITSLLRDNALDEIKELLNNGLKACLIFKKAHTAFDSTEYSMQLEKIKKIKSNFTDTSQIFYLSCVKKWEQELQEILQELTQNANKAIEYDTILAVFKDLEPPSKKVNNLRSLILQQQFHIPMNSEDVKSLHQLVQSNQVDKARDILEYFSKISAIPKKATKQDLLTAIRNVKSKYPQGNQFENLCAFGQGNNAFYIQDWETYSSSGAKGNVSISYGNDSQKIFINKSESYDDIQIAAALRIVKILDLIKDQKNIQSHEQRILKEALAEFKSISQPAAINLTSTSIKLTPAQEQAILLIRQPLIKELQQYFKLDPFGYIVEPLSDKAIGQIEQAIAKDEKKIAQLFYKTSQTGDPAYAEDIRTTLSGMNIGSTPVDKDTSLIEGKPHNLTTTRPVSFVKNKGQFQGTKEPAIYKKASAYISIWGNAIWKGYRDYRHALSNYKNNDKNLTPQQLMDYSRRQQRIRDLHHNGYLIGRVADTQEVKDFIGHRYLMGNDILSTTLWPTEGAGIVMQLFSEYGTDTVGLLLDHTRTGQEDFGVSFSQNAGTVGSGFQKHKLRRKSSSNQGDGATTFHAQKGLLDALSAEVKEGGSVYNLNVSLSKDGSHYEVKKHDARTGSSAIKSKKINWNEQTFYRGIERDFFTGLFVKSESNNFSKELKTLFELQDKIRRKKGIYVPIFQFKGSINKLEELVPDKLLVNITGANVTPIEGRSSQFSQELRNAGITDDMALEMSKAIGTQGTIKSLFELQLLMFNMKDIMGQMTIPVASHQGTSVSFSFTPVRILDNLHLVFPTIHKTQNPDAQQPDFFFNNTDIKTIASTSALENYLKLTLKYNMGRFLGVLVTGQTVKFDPNSADVFDQSDMKKADFAKVLSRALQSAVLFQIFGPTTNTTVNLIVQEIRKKWPYIGITPGGIDMILGSKEMQEILNKKGSPVLTKQLEPNNILNKVELPLASYSIDALDPFKKIDLPSKQDVTDFLAELGINPDGSLNQTTFKKFQDSDPHLLDYEKLLIQTVQMLYLINQRLLAQKIIQNIRTKCLGFGYNVDGTDNSETKNDALMRWLQEASQKLPHQTEFPFGKKAKVKVSSSTNGRTPLRGRAAASDDDEEENYTRGSRRSLQHSSPSQSSSQVEIKSITNEPQLDDKGLQTQVKDKNILPKLNQDQFKAAKKLGLIDGLNQPLWIIEPKFHNGDQGKPVNPYIAVKDLLGHYTPHLMTGPAYEPLCLQKDRDSFELSIDPKNISDINIIEHLVTDTLAVTTEGDLQVLRPNGLQYSQSACVPMGGNIEFNGGNEKHRFRSNKKRIYHNSAYSGMGAYTDQALKNVEDFDQQLLSDKERRIKRAGLLASAYVTVTAEGGFGIDRKPLDRAYRILYLATAGAQFEKYGRGAFTYQNGDVDENELEATDFIIKQGAKVKKNPLFPHYYSNGSISAHKEIQPTQCSKLDDGNFTLPYVGLNDGSLFNREAFQKANDQYMADLVIPKILEKVANQPFYLKAILLGGGFFAQANEAGNLRSEVINTTLKSYIKAIHSGLVPPNSVIEFPRYGDLSIMPSGLIEQLRLAAKNHNIEIVWTNEGDVCDFRPQTSLSGQTIDLEKFEKNGCLVCLGAADAMSWHGNEPSSASLEASFGNNSNLRLVMNWWANAKVFDAIKKLKK